MDVLIGLAPAITSRASPAAELEHRLTALVAALPASAVRELELALTFANHPLVALIYSGKLTRLSRRRPESAADQLRRMASSRLPLVRSISVGIRRAAAGIVYAGRDAAESVTGAAT